MPSRERTAVWGGRGANPRPREAEWRSGVAAVFGVPYKKDIFRNLFGYDPFTTEEY